MPHIRRHYLGAVPMLVSHQISRMPNDLVRTNTAVINAYFHRALATALYRAEDSDAAPRRGLRFTRSLIVTTADYGVGRVAKTPGDHHLPVGPGLGACARRRVVLADHFGNDQVLSIDVGGTTSDVSLQWYAASRRRPNTDP